MTSAAVDTIFEYAPKADESAASNAWKRAIVTGGVVFSGIIVARRVVGIATIFHERLNPSSRPPFGIYFYWLTCETLILAACLTGRRGKISMTVIRWWLAIACIAYEIPNGQSMFTGTLAMLRAAPRSIWTHLQMVSYPAERAQWWHWVILMFVLLRPTSRITLRTMLIAAALFGATATVAEWTSLAVDIRFFRSAAARGYIADPWEIASDYASPVAATIMLGCALLALFHTVRPKRAMLAASIALAAAMGIRFVANSDQYLNRPFIDWFLHGGYLILTHAMSGFLIFFLAWMLVRARPRGGPA